MFPELSACPEEDVEDDVEEDVVDEAPVDDEEVEDEEVEDEDEDEEVIEDDVVVDEEIAVDEDGGGEEPAELAVRLVAPTSEVLKELSKPLLTDKLALLIRVVPSGGSELVKALPAVLPAAGVEVVLGAEAALVPLLAVDASLLLELDVVEELVVELEELTEPVESDELVVAVVAVVVLLTENPGTTFNVAGTRVVVVTVAVGQMFELPPAHVAVDGGCTLTVNTPPVTVIEPV